MSDLEPENNIPRELLRDIIRSQYPDTQELSDDEIDELIDSGEMQLQVHKFSPSCSKKMCDLLDSDADEEEIMNSIMQQIMYLNDHGNKELIGNDGPVQFFNIDEKKFTDIDTSDVIPLSPEDLKKMFDSN